MLSHVIYYGLSAAEKAGTFMGADPAIVSSLRWVRRGFAVWRGIETIQNLSGRASESADPSDGAPVSSDGDVGFGD
jgi:hypothetical protein